MAKNKTELNNVLAPLPDEVTLHISSFMDAKSLTLFSSTAKQYQDLLTEAAKRQRQHELFHSISANSDATFVYDSYDLYFSGQFAGKTLQNSTKFSFYRGAVKKLVTNTTHSALLTHDGSVFTAGRGDEGRLGYPAVQNKDFTQVQLDFEVIDIQVGAECTVILNTKKELWATGKLGDIDFGIGFQQIPLPFAEDAIKQWSLTHQHLLLCTCAGNVWAIGELENNYNQFMQVTALTDVIKVIASVEFSMALTRQGEVWVWGDNLANQLGIGGPVTTQWYNEFTKLSLEYQVKDIAAGNSFTAFLTHDGKLMLSGQMLEGGDELHFSVPTEYALLDGKDKIQTLTAGRRHLIVVTENDNIFGLGLNDYGQLGIADGQYHSHFVALNEQLEKALAPVASRRCVIS